MTFKARMLGSVMLCNSLLIFSTAGAEQLFENSNRFIGSVQSCTAVRNMAKNQISAYKRGSTEAEIIKKLGGVNSLEPYQWKVVSYVSQFKDSEEVTINEVAKLAYDHCISGSFDD